jgi:transcription elongation factor GreA
MVAMNSQVMLTEVGWRRLHDELTELRQRRAEAAESVGTSSPSEIEYLSHCIAEVEYVLSRAVPVDSEEREPGVVGVGSEVEVIWDDEDRETYTIVSPPEVSPLAGRISYASPVGLALMGRSTGQEVTVVTEDRTNTIRVAAVR